MENTNTQDEKVGQQPDNSQMGMVPPEDSKAEPHFNETNVGNPMSGPGEVPVSGNTLSQSMNQSFNDMKKGQMPKMSAQDIMARGGIGLVLLIVVLWLGTIIAIGIVVLGNGGPFFNSMFMHKGTYDFVMCAWIGWIVAFVINGLAAFIPPCLALQGCMNCFDLAMVIYAIVAAVNFYDYKPQAYMAYGVTEALGQMAGGLDEMASSMGGDDEMGGSISAEISSAISGMMPVQYAEFDSMMKACEAVIWLRILPLICVGFMCFFGLISAICMGVFKKK